jgi:hypothetical protein
MQKAIGIILFSIGVLLSIQSCKKDDDSQAPVISISSPYENEIFDVYDVALVAGNVRDDQKLESVTVNLLDEQNNVAYIGLPVPFTSPSSSFQVSYALDNIHLESGIYYIHITASDGVNDANAYKKIQINAVPKVLKNVLVSTAANSSQTKLYSIDSTFSVLNPVHSFSGDYIGASASSYFQQFTNCGNYSGAFSSIDLTTNVVKYTVPCVISASPYFTGYYATEKFSYVSYYNGFVKGYDHNGNVMYNANANPNHYIENFGFNGGYLLAEQVDKQTSARVLTSHQTTGVGYQQTGITQDVIAFCEKDNSNVFVFGNVAGQGVIQLFDRNNNNLWNPYPFPLATGALLSAVKIDSNTFLLGHSNGTIYKYQYQTSSVTTYLAGYIAKQLIFDDLNNEIYVVENNSISRFNYATAAVQNSIASPETILGLHLLYNR